MFGFVMRMDKKLKKKKRTIIFNILYFIKYALLYFIEYPLLYFLNTRFYILLHTWF
jgi:hypothetical protein